MPERLRDLVADLAAVLLGLTVFFTFCGWWVLIPSNIAWLDFGDRAMHQLGWMFYRTAPWSLPPGLSPDLGIELSNSIALVDGLPLFAIPFKLIAQWLPQPFQYWGYWLLLSFSLHSFFAFRLAREFGAGGAMALAAAAFALITPALLFRIPMHLALSGHWVVLAALYLYARRTPPRLYAWPLLLGLTAAIHGTLLAMVLALWVAAWLQRLWLGRFRFGPAALEAALGALATLAILWLVGFLTTGSYGTYGYGDYKLNLLWPLLSYRWSQLFPDLPHTRFDYEGLSFLGIGIFALLAIAILSGAIIRLRAIATRQWLPLALAVIGMMLFAFSKNLSLGPTDIANLTMPGVVEKLGAAFRSTGRFVWPLLYLVTIGTVVLVAGRFHILVALPLALAAFTAQAVDSAPAWRSFALHMTRPAPIWRSPLDSPLWGRAVAAGYDRVRAIPVRTGLGSDWKDLGYFAVLNGMATDVAYLGRIDDAALARLRAKAETVLGTGDFEPRTIYILDVPAGLRAAAHKTAGDLLAIVDRRIVFIRDGAGLAAGLDLEGPALPD